MGLYQKKSNGKMLIASLGGSVINDAEMQHYSEEERIIGYWTDGKPLYRQTLVEALTGTNTSYVESSFSNSGKEIKKFNVYGQYPTYNNSFEQITGYLANTGKFMIKQLWSANSIQFISILVIEYTKTIDTPNTNNNTYSLNEVLTGETWVDGKPIYRQCFPTGLLPNNGETHIDVSRDIDMIVEMKGCIQSSANPEQKRVFPFVGEPNSTNNIRIDHVENGKCRIITYSDWSKYSGYLIIEYTKTTD